MIKTGMVKEYKVYFSGIACAVLVACGPSAAEIAALEKLEAKEAEIAKAHAYNQKVMRQKKRPKVKRTRRNYIIGQTIRCSVRTL